MLSVNVEKWITVVNINIFFYSLLVPTLLTAPSLIYTYSLAHSYLSFAPSRPHKYTLLQENSHVSVIRKDDYWHDWNQTRHMNKRNIWLLLSNCCHLI